MLPVSQVSGTAANRCKVIALIGLSLYCASPLLGAPSALIQIPIADVIESGHAYLDIATLPAEGEQLFDNSTVESCFGVGGDTELGFDGPSRTLRDGTFFFKKRLGRYRDVSAALGINGIDFRGSEWNPYLVCSTETSPLRTHVGGDYADKKWRAMVGIEYAATDRLTWMADWITGREGAWSCGFNLTFRHDQAWGLMIGLIGENGSRDKSLYVNLGREFAF